MHAGRLLGSKNHDVSGRRIKKVINIVLSLLAMSYQCHPLVEFVMVHTVSNVMFLSEMYSKMQFSIINVFTLSNEAAEIWTLRF